MDEPKPGQQTVYVNLLDEGVDVWRPVQADEIGGGCFRLHGPVPETESWQFQPGAIVRCKERWLSGGYCLVAAELVADGSGANRPP